VKWEKRGHIYAPDGTTEWAQSHAFPPTPYLREDGILRLYVCFCDADMVGRVGFVDVEPGDPSRVLRVARDPVLDVGSIGAFDENGVVPLSVARVDDRLFLYYVGFQLGMRVRYYQFAGLAISTDGGESFVRASRAPVLDRSDDELLTRGSPFVLFDETGFRMWYAAGSEWTTVDGKALPVYNIRYLESEDGHQWPNSGEPCIDFADQDEHALGRPWVFKEGGLFRMFYSVRTRSRGYRIGYADSSDGKSWTRKDAVAGIDVSASGWDSEMVCYASIFRRSGTTTMFYNGNQVGRTGFGYAVLVHADPGGSVQRA
jgi:hypothetical protein